MIYIVKDRQTLLDVALVCYGAADSVIELAQENNISLSATLEPGSQITYKQANKSVINKVYAMQKIAPATALEGALKCDGIGYMGIEIDFIIS
ncbi:MAG: hypothetical protein RR386_08830 [Bacteroidaceae bacterium]